MRNLLLLVLVGMGVVGCSRDLNRGEVCTLGFRFAVMERLDRFSNHDYWWLAEIVHKDGKPIPCHEAK